MNRKDYFSSKDNLHYTHEEMYNSNFPTFNATLQRPPIYVTYNIIDSTAETASFNEVVKEYISQSLLEATDDLVNQVAELALEKIQGDISLSIADAVEQAFSEIGTISEDELDLITQN